MLGRGKIILLMEQVLDTLTFFFLARSVNEASLKRYISSSSIPYSNPKYYRGVHQCSLYIHYTTLNTFT